ncbi:MAG: hypothetical protein AAB553_01590 [Patescibacteria group bacterium]
MIQLQRLPNNPIITPNPQSVWEAVGAFNGSVAKGPDGYHIVYRALSSEQEIEGVSMRLSTIGYATSTDGITFGEHIQLIKPTEEWEKYGCEDPRITFFNGKYYIFYTALSTYPFSGQGIKTAVAITKDFKNIEKHPVSTFNAKAMALFPERINGKMAALITINTDYPPAKIALATFDHEEEIWSPYFWQEWYDNANDHIIQHLLLDMRDQVELGSQPIKTTDGWLIIYSYIQNYLGNEKIFGIEAAMLDLEDPRKLLGRIRSPLLIPEEKYELEGDIPDIIFPSGAIVKDETLLVYYGAADTRTAVASCPLQSLVDELLPHPHTDGNPVPEDFSKLKRFSGNPILTPALELDWQARCVFNPAAIYEGGKIHILYRAQSMNGTSVVGYASTTDGFHIEENLDDPIYMPRADFEKKIEPVGNSGCEDPRIAKVGDRIIMCYTAYDGERPPRVAMTSISLTDFLKKQWDTWEMPKLISLADVDDKDACIVEGKKPGAYLIFHRMHGSIWLQVADHLNFGDGEYITGDILAQARSDNWDNVKLGIAGPPLPTEKGWLLLYHAVCDPGSVYKVGAMLLDYDDPFKILARTDAPIFEPETMYEKVGEIPNVVFPCGAIIKDDTIFVYYGGADKVVGVATMPIKQLLQLLTKE